MAAVDLLAFGAHPDDVELSCGGLVALAASRGQRVVIIDLTRGELATNGTVAIRTEEAEAAAAALGIETRENLELPDGELRADDADQLAAVVEALRHHRPRVVLSPWVEARHPDHAAAGQLVERAAFLAGVARFRPDLGPPGRPDRVVFYPARREVRPSFVVDITAVADLKARAIGCHKSQFGGDGAPTLINAPLGVEAFAVRDRYWGATIGVRHGEPYLIRGPVPLPDPVSALSEDQSPPVLLPA